MVRQVVFLKTPPYPNTSISVFWCLGTSFHWSLSLFALLLLPLSGFELRASHARELLAATLASVSLDLSYFEFEFNQGLIIGWSTSYEWTCSLFRWTRTRTNTNPNDTEANSAGRSGNARALRKQSKCGVNVSFQIYFMGRGLTSCSPCTSSSVQFRIARKARAYISGRCIGFCVTWICVGSWVRVLWLGIVSEVSRSSSVVVNSEWSCVDGCGCI